MSDEFRDAIRDVTPLAGRARADLRTPPPPPVARQRALDDAQVLVDSVSAPLTIEDAIGTGEELAYLRDGQSPQVLRRLRRGHWVVQASLDLHGMNRLQAAQEVPSFLARSLRHGLRCVRIVHGRGLGSRNREPVLKHLLAKWLPRRDEVLAFSQAPLAHGGSGATLVLLKAAR